MNTINGFEYLFYQDVLGENQLEYRNQCYQFVNVLKNQYPYFDDWYRSLFTPWGFLKDNREIILCKYGEEIAGIAILKKEEQEKKICTLRVAKKFQRMSIGKNLMLQSFSWLETDKPLITVHRWKQAQFRSLFRYFGFQLEDKKWNYYQRFSEELSYNGVLPEQHHPYSPWEPTKRKNFRISPIYRPVSKLFE